MGPPSTRWCSTSRSGSHNQRTMALTVDAAFTAYYDAINITSDLRSDANARKDFLVGVIKKQLEVTDAFPSGSIARFTGIRDHSDVDIMVVLHYSKHIKDKSPAEVLQLVRDALGEYRPNVRKNGQAVTVKYKTWPHVDVVPAAKWENAGEFSHYEIPDTTTGTWIKTDPKSHSEDIDSAASACGANFRKIVKMAKAWNKSHSDYLQSYHLEVIALKGLTGQLDDLPWNVFQFFEKAAILARTTLWNGHGYADAYLSAVDRSQAVDRLDRAREGARTAWHYGFRGEQENAIGAWRSVFGDQFPRFG